MATPLPPEDFGPDLEQLGAIGGLLTARDNYIPNIQSAYGAIIQNAPDYQYFTAPLSNQGRTTASYGTTNQIVVAPDTPIRVVNNATGEVVASGTGYEGAQTAIDAANALASSAGSKANYDIQVVRPGGTSFESVSTERPDVSGLGIIADVALPVAASLLVPGGGFLGTILPAAGGSALSSVAQGRSLEDTLLRAALAGGGAGIGEVAFAPAQVASQTATQAATQTGTQAAGQAATQAVASAAPSAIGDILVTALGGIPAAAGGAFGSLAGSIVPSVFDAAQLNNVATMDQVNVEQPSDWTVTARIPPATLPVTPPVIVPPTTPPTIPVNPAEDLVVTAKDVTPPSVVPPIVVPPGIIPPATGPGTTTTTDTTPAKKDDGVLGTGLNIAELASILGVGADLLGNLLGGGGGTGPTTPYVSPFGPSAGTGLAARTQVNPNIIDYERYGFGPEAAFFSGVQSGPVTYKPLI